jgi:hypothetical protein
MNRLRRVDMIRYIHRLIDYSIFLRFSAERGTPPAVRSGLAHNGLSVVRWQTCNYHPHPTPPHVDRVLTHRENGCDADCFLMGSRTASSKSWC